MTILQAQYRNKLRNMEPELLSEENKPSTVSLASAISNEVIETTPELPDIPDDEVSSHLMTPQKCPIFPLIMNTERHKLRKPYNCSTDTPI